jgi:hypothetical protein
VWVYGAGKKEKKEKKDRARSQTTVSKTINGAETPPPSTRQQASPPAASGENTINKHIQCGNNTHGKLWVKGACTIKQTPTYTGTKIIGIGTMHKSNLVPIFSDQEAIDVSKMRR